MSLFNPDVPVTKQKEKSHHPWERRIRGLYSSTYKYGHNSAKNPIFPPKKEKLYKERVRFTVIGNRISKDFIYCYYLVKGLHKYRKKLFEAPVIRGVTGVEWPKVLSDLKREYGGLLYLVSSEAVVFINNKVLGGREELKKYVRPKYVYHLNLDYVKEGIQQFANYINSCGRPCAYLNVSIDGECIGSLIFMLYSDIVPLTCENFLEICETPKGGYSGTPVHRIVKNGWIQCGGFGLKNDFTLDCENFIVPHDRRGVLCMANNGRHNDCSTQFFVLLQPATWMAGKYVAFGQLIEGEGTLNKIENVPTWYESPTAEIVIYKAGVFNMDCQYDRINKNTNVYLQAHTENLTKIGEIFYEELIQKVFASIQFRYLKQLEDLRTAREDALEEAEIEIYLKRKAEIQKQLEEVRRDQRPGTPASGGTAVNNDFDVDVYEYEIEEYSYQHLTVAATHSVVEKPEISFYLPFTDVPYPGEVQSTFDLKGLLKGDYCHEADLETGRTETTKQERRLSIPSDALAFLFDSYNISPDESDTSVDTEDELEITKYLDHNSDRASFAGRVVKKMAHKRKKYDVFDRKKYIKLKDNIITDEELRLMRVATREYIMNTRKKKVSIVISSSNLAPFKIKRRQTGFIRLNDLHKIHALIKMSSQNLAMLLDDDDDDDDFDEDDVDKDELYRQLRTAPTSLRHYRNQQYSSFAPRSDLDSHCQHKHSVLTRLYDEVAFDHSDDIPTLKNYKPYEEGKQTSYLLLSNLPIDTAESSKGKYLQSDLSRMSIDQVLALQHGKHFRKISSDYVRTIDNLEHSIPNSIRTMEFSKKRPCLSIHQYRLQNEQYRERMKEMAAIADTSQAQRIAGLDNAECKKVRLSGDCPIHEKSKS